MPIQIAPLTPEALRWRVDEKSLLRQTTAVAARALSVHGQPIAQEALRYALTAGDSFRQHVFIRAPAGLGCRSVMQALHTSFKPPHRAPWDYCYVYNFVSPSSPQLLALPSGAGRALVETMEFLAEFIAEKLPQVLDSAPLKARRDAISERTLKAINELTRPLEEELKANGLALVRVRDGSLAQMAVFPTVVGKPVPPEEFQQLVESGQVDRREWERYQSAMNAIHERSAQVADQVMKLWRDGQKTAAAYEQKEIQRILHEIARDAEEVLQIPACRKFVTAAIADVVNHFAAIKAGTIDPRRRYAVNAIITADGDIAPLVFAASADPAYLFGGLQSASGGGLFDYGHLHLYSGHLAAANGGFLVLSATELIERPENWRLLAEVLKSRSVDLGIFSSEYRRRGLSASPLPINVRVVLIGDAASYQTLYNRDERFAELFNFVIDFDDCCARDQQGLQLYRDSLQRLQQDEALPEMKIAAIAALIEQGARLAGRPDKLTLRLESIFNITREAAAMVRDSKRQSIDAEDVRSAIARREYRHSLLRRDYFRRIGEETINIRVQGKIVGQVNGLSIRPTLPELFGIPLRITCVFEPGRDAAIKVGGPCRPSSLPLDSATDLNQTRQENAIYGSPANALRLAANDAFLVCRMDSLLRSLLSTLLAAPHPLQFTAYLNFASDHPGDDAEHCTAACAAALLSAVAGTALRQNLALAGSLDFTGQLLPVSDINERIEGFYDCVQSLESSGVHGVIIPKSNRRDLMLRPDIVRACTNGKFQIYAVDALHRALELLTEIPTGVQIDGRFPEGSLLAAATKRLYGDKRPVAALETIAATSEATRRLMR